MSGINAMDTYRVYFHFPKDSGTPSTGIVYAIYTIGSLVGSFASGPAADKWGRLRNAAYQILQSMAE
jgi:MFS family permease